MPTHPIAPPPTVSREELIRRISIVLEIMEQLPQLSGWRALCGKDGMPDAESMRLDLIASGREVLNAIRLAPASQISFIMDELAAPFLKMFA